MREVEDSLARATLEKDVEALVTDLGLEFVGLEFQAGRSSGVLRIYIDQPDTGVTVDDCARVSRELSGLLDVEDPIPGQYTLEVSSPGLDRPLFRPGHYQTFIGAEIKLVLSQPLDGRRRFRGVIEAVEGAQVHLRFEGKELVFDVAEVESARIIPEF
jgi:ribosome maturation factor RimP